MIVKFFQLFKSIFFFQRHFVQTLFLQFSELTHRGSLSGSLLRCRLARDSPPCRFLQLCNIANSPRLLNEWARCAGQPFSVMSVNDAAVLKIY
jgi:hypothetical protein